MTTLQKRNSKSGNWKVFGPILAILALVIAGLFVIKVQFAGKNFHSSEDSVEIRVGQTLPDFQLTPVQKGKPIELSRIPGKIFLVTFWATWCEACMNEMPSIVRLQNLYKNRGLEVLGINLDENPESVVLKVAQQFNISFSVFKDPDGKVADLFDVHAIPLTVIFNQQRKILYVKDGEQNWTAPEIKTLMDRWLSE